MKKLLFLPIDLETKIDNNEVISNLNAIRKFHVWNFQALIDTSIGPWNKNYITKKSKEMFPTLCKAIELLPYDYICNAKINFQNNDRPMAPHLDVRRESAGEELWNNITENEPCGYRIVISGLSNTLKIHLKDKIVTANMPKIKTSIYAISQSEAVHHVEYDINRIICYTHGYINKEKHEKLIQKSLNKYNEYAVWSDS
jgi:vancomycin resistance protein YoaR